MGFRWQCGNFFNGANNRAESMNAKLKQIVERFTSLELFVERFFAFINTQKNEKAHKAALTQQKRKVLTAADEAGEHYSRLLTPYAYDRVKE